MLCLTKYVERGIDSSHIKDVNYELYSTMLIGCRKYYHFLYRFDQT